jgi:hypothetical protein
VVVVDYDYMLNSFNQVLPFFQCINDHLNFFCYEFHNLFQPLRTSLDAIQHDVVVHHSYTKIT